MTDDEFWFQVAYQMHTILDERDDLDEWFARCDSWLLNGGEG